MSLIKTNSQIEQMREAGKILTEALSNLNDKISIGTDVWTLEEYFIDFCKTHNVVPACKGYTAGGYLPPFPTGLCVYINEQAVHCFPIKGQILKEGDTITIDTVIKHREVFVDSSFAKGIGNLKESHAKLLKTAKEAVPFVESFVRPDIKVGILSHNMQKFVESNGFNVLRDYAGHGIGTKMHEIPDIPCYGSPNDGILLKEGMTICIESLICEGSYVVEEVSDWETKMKDNKRYLQFEHTILVTKEGYENLTPLSVE